MPKTLNVYTMNLYEQDTDNMLLRFWDTRCLEMRGLKAMGETAGLPRRPWAIETMMS